MDPPIDAEKAVLNNKLLSIEVDIYMSNKRQNAILVITEGLLVLIYKASKSKVLEPVKFNEIQAMYLAENVPSAAALQMSDEMAAKTGHSHLIIESQSMALLMRYINDNDFEAEIDFNTELQIKSNGTPVSFEFYDLVLAKRIEANNYSNAKIRSVH